jgi:hypothetical protein
LLKSLPSLEEFVWCLRSKDDVRRNAKQAWKKGKGYSNEFYRRSLSTELWINIYIQKSYLPCINIFG